MRGDAGAGAEAPNARERFTCRQEKGVSALEMGTPGPSTREQILARHGDACWLCNGQLDFGPDAVEGKKPTIEHLQPQSLGGGNDPDNLRLCHKSCNLRLSNKPLAEKERIRAKFRLDAANNKAKMAAARASAKPKASGQGKAAKPASPAGVTSAKPVAPPERTVPAADWHRLAFVATAAATFFAGLSLGMLVG